MNLRTFALVATLVLLGVFTLLNWTAFTTPTTLFLGLGEVQAPLGLVMLVVMAAVSALFVLYILFQQASVIAESRRLGKELKAQRALADQAEASRFTEVRSFIEAELRRVESNGAVSTRELGERIDRLGRELTAHLDESTRSLAAHLGEVEDKLDRALPGRAAG